jgi:hypothetical protein
MVRMNRNRVPAKLIFGLLLMAAVFVSTASPAYAQVYVGSERKGVSAYHTATGEVINSDLVVMDRGADPYALMIAGNTLYVGDASGRTVGTYDATTGAPINATLITGLSSPRGLLLFGSDILVADGSRVGRYRASNGSAVNVAFITGVSRVVAIVLSGNTLYVAQDGVNRVGTFNATTGAPINPSFITGLSTPQGMEIHGNSIFVANWLGGTVAKYDATTGKAVNVNFITGLSGPIPLRVWRDTLYVLDYVNRTLGKYDPVTGAAINASFITNLPVWPNGLVIEDSTPAASAGTDFTVDEDQSGVMLDGSGSSDPEGDPLSYAWAQTGGPMASLSDLTAEQPMFTAPEIAHGAEKLTFEVTVAANGKVSKDTVEVTVLGSLTVSRFKAKLNFKKTDKDLYTLKGELDLPPEFEPDGADFELNVGGVLVVLRLDAKGKARTATEKVKLSFSKRTGRWSLRVKLKKGNFAGAWADEGAKNMTVKENVEFRFTANIGGEMFGSTVPHSYAGKFGKVGKVGKLK